MAKENEIVDEINSRLQSRVFASKRFQKGSFDGIAELVKTEEEGDTMPGIIAEDGEVSYLGIDDTKPFQVYHRLLSSTPEYDSTGDFGEPKGLKITANMLMVVVGDRFRLQLTREDIMAGIAAGMPLEISQTLLNTLNIKSCNIVPGQFNTDRETVYREEYHTKEYLLKTNSIMFSFSYQIVTYIDQTCFELCN
jgi:hypothetical protein